MLAAMADATSPMSVVQLRGLGVAIAGVGNDRTAFAHRDRRYLVAVLGLWLGESEDRAPHKAWVEALWRELRPVANGAGSPSTRS